MRRLFGLMALIVSEIAYAGMPVVTLSDTAKLRLSGISFFLLTILLVAWGVRSLWNLLRRDFPRWPW